MSYPAFVDHTGEVVLPEFDRFHNGMVRPVTGLIKTDGKEGV